MPTTQNKLLPELEVFARRALLERRRVLSTIRGRADDEARELREKREPDWEDQAANLAAASNLDRLGDNERAQLVRVQAALDRLDEGTWGRCLSCGAAIDERRLRAAPESARCAGCSARSEA